MLKCGFPRGSVGSVPVWHPSPARPDPAVQPLHTGELAAVDARFESFTLTSDAYRNFNIADCELVEELARQILSMLAARDVKSDITRVPYQEKRQPLLAASTDIARTAAGGA